MTRFLPYVFAGILLITCATGALGGGDNRLLNAGVAAAVVGAAIVFASLKRDVRPTIWAIAACASLAAAVMTLVIGHSKVDECTAVNALGERVVIGEEFTEEGAKYKKNHPSETASEMLETVPPGSQELIWKRESINRCAFILAASSALWAPLFGLAAVSATAMTFRNVPPSLPAAPKRQAFISYNHEDAAAALKLKQALMKHSIPVVVDVDRMHAGERIEEFIERSIRESDVVLSLVSNRSLLSSWVALETINTLNRNKWVEDRLFIACYLDDDFFRPEYRLECTRQIDARLASIEQLIPEYAANKLDTVDLNQEKTRLYDLRNNLGTILATLKQVLCLDLRESQFAESEKKLVAAIRNLHGQSKQAKPVM